MTDERWKLLTRDPDVDLTPEEEREGWHFCHDWNFLVGPGMREFETCNGHYCHWTPPYRSLRRVIIERFRACYYWPDDTDEQRIMTYAALRTKAMQGCSEHTAVLLCEALLN